MNFIDLFSAPLNGEPLPSNEALISVETVFLATSALIACLVCIFLVFNYGRRIQFSGRQRKDLVEGLMQPELARGLAKLDEEAISAPLDSENNPFPDDISPPYYHSQIWTEATALRDYVDWEEPFESDPDWDDATLRDEESKWFKDSEKRRRERKEKYKRMRSWEIEERKIYAKRKKAIEENARAEAEASIPQMEISLLGGGFSFLLEFSTVIVIIFAIIILGVLGTFEGKEIATILAAIAGYVLGKASSQATEKKEPNP